jgi:hypothetical protein
VLACKSWCEANKKKDGACNCGNRLIFCHASDPAAAKRMGAPHHGGGHGAPHHGQRPCNQGRPRTPAAGGAPNRFAALAPQRQVQPQVQRAPPPKKAPQAPPSRFAALEESSDEEDRSAW